MPPTSCRGTLTIERDIFVRDLLTNTTTRVSASSSGERGNNDSLSNSISADGRFVAFRSFASNLVPGDTNNTSDIFVRDLLTNTTTRVSVDSAGNQGNYTSENFPSISADGRFVAFQSYATNLVPGDTNNRADIFVRDLSTNTTTLVSVSSSGDRGNGRSPYPSISADGTVCGV
jgi:Tol biopolymer transport system component